MKTQKNLPVHQIKTLKKSGVYSGQYIPWIVFRASPTAQLVLLIQRALDFDFQCMIKTGDRTWQQSGLTQMHQRERISNLQPISGATNSRFLVYQTGLTNFCF